MKNIIISIATTGDRPEQLKQAVKSLANQGTILIYDNSINIDYTDNAKFFWLESLHGAYYYLTCDDDLIYPPTYVEDMINAVDRYGTIVTCHGRVLKEGRNKYYKSDHEEYSFQHEIVNPVQLDVAGTGCTAFNTKYFKPSIYNSRYKCMSDLVFSLEAIKQGKEITLMPHKRDYIKPIPVKNTIFKRESNGTQENQVYLMNQILNEKARRKV